MMNKPTLQPGDVFATVNPMALGRAINAVQRWWSRDGVSEYSHVGIICDSSGETFEARWTNRKAHLDDYRGQRILIARPMSACGAEELPPSLRWNCLHRLRHEYEGRLYPLWRLGFHLVPPLAKASYKSRWLVCSELVAKFLHYCGSRHGQYAGTNPENLVYEWRYWRNFKIIFEGEWE